MPKPRISRVFWDEYSWSAAEFEFARENTTAYERLAAFTIDSQTLRLKDRTQMLVTGLVSGEAFDVLSTAPLLGSGFELGHEKSGADSVVVLSYDFWRREMAGDDSVVGRQLELDGAPATVVGVMPEGFFYPSPEVEVWRPLTVDAAERDYRGNHWLVVFGRIHDGWSNERVEADLGRFTMALGENFEYPEAWDKTRNAFVEPMRQYLFGDIRPALLLLLGSVALLLLMATANVAGLMVARMSDRESELAIRKAMGAGRSRLSRQLITESLVLGTTAAGFGLGLAWLGYRAIVDRLPLPTGFGQTLSLDGTVLIATLALIPAITLFVAVAPLRRLWVRPVSSRLRAKRNLAARLAARGAIGRRGGLQKSLVVGQIVIAVVLVTSAVLLARSVVELYRIDSGLDTSGVAALDLYVADADLDAEQRSSFYQSLIEQATASAGVESAAIINRLPLRDDGVQGPLTAEGRPDLEGPNGPNCKWRYVSNDFFRTLGIDLTEGRSFDATDRRDGRQVAVIGADFAERPVAR